MNFVKQYPGFVATIALCVLIFIAEIALIFVKSGAVSDGLKASSNAYNSAKSAAFGETAPTQANVDAAESNLAKIEASLARMTDAIGVHEKVNVDDLSSSARKQRDKDRSKLPLEINEMASQWKTMAKRQIEDEEGKPRDFLNLPEDMKFGLDEYWTTPPVDETFDDALKQKEIIQYLVDVLFKSEDNSIESIESIERSYIAEDPDAEDQVALARERDSIDGVFVIDRKATAAAKGSINTLSLRFVFRGSTAVFRSFLLAIPKFKEQFGDTLVVRDVLVKSAAGNQRRAAAGATKKTNDPFAVFGIENTEETEDLELEVESPIVENNFSEFAVTVELIRVVNESEEAGEEGVAE